MRSGPDQGEVRPIAIPGIHERFVPYFLGQAGTTRPQRVLDVGAGHGALSQRLTEDGFEVSACDKFPEKFHFTPVECNYADLADPLPYGDEAFDLIAAVEVTEHIHDHRHFFAECSRILKPGGKLLISTPNILSLKSRLRFFTTGYPYSFEPLDLDQPDGLQHVAALSLDQYRYVARQNELSLDDVSFDLWQRTSIALLPLWPLLPLAGRYFRTGPSDHNRLKVLLGRILFLTFRKPGAGADPLSP